MSSDLKAPCIIHSGYCFPSGYGQVYFRGRHWRAHRAAWVKANGDIPRGKVVCHTCDNPACVNVDHLFLGTQKENVHDCMRKGRFGNHKRMRGEKHARAILMEDEAREILSSPERGRVLAKKFGVSESTVSAVRHGRLWKYLSEKK